MTFLSDYSKLNDIYTFSKPKERKKKTLQEAQSIGKMYSSIVSRYLDGIKGQIRSLVINSGGKDLNVGKIIQPALKVLWYEGLHEGLFYDRKITFHKEVDLYLFANDDPSKLRLQKIQALKTLRDSQLTKEERLLLDVYDSLDKVQQLTAVGRNSPGLNSALAKRALRKETAQRLREVDKKLKDLVPTSDLLDYEDPNQILQKFDTLKTTKEKQAYYDRLSIENRKILRAYVMEVTPENTLRQIKDYDATGKKLGKDSKASLDRSYVIESNRRLSEDQIESKSRSSIKSTDKRIEEEVNTIIDNPSLSRKEKRQALSRLVSPTTDRSFPIHDKEKVQKMIKDMQVSSQIRVPSRKDKTELATLLKSKNKPNSLGSILDVDIRERIRDIETYYPYIASTEERESDIQAYVDARTLELSNYYTEEFKESVKSRVTDITKGKKESVKSSLKDLFNQIESGINPERKEKYYKLKDQVNKAFVKASSRVTETMSSREENLYKAARKEALKKYRSIDKVKEERKLERLREIYEAYSVDEIGEENPLIADYLRKGKTKQEILIDLSTRMEKIRQFLRTSEAEYVKGYGEIAKKKIKEDRKPRTAINVSDLDPDLREELIAAGVIKENQKVISSKGLEIIKERLSKKALERDLYLGVNPKVAEQHKSLEEARRLARRKVQQDKNGASPSEYVDSFYAEIHGKKVGHPVKKQSEEWYPDNIDNLITNPYQRLERVLNNELATSYNLGRMEAFIRNGVSQVRWISILDSNTSTFCTSLNNRIFNISEIQAFSAGRGLVYDYFPNTRKTFDEVKRNSAIGVFYMPSVHPYCRSYLEPVPPQEELQTEKKNYFSAYQQALSEQLASAKITPESLVNNERILQAMVVMGAVALNIKARSDRKKKEEERKKLMVTAGAVAVAGLGAYAMARSRVGKELYDNALENLSKGKRVQPESEVIENFIDATSRSIDDAVEQVTDTRVPLALPPAPQPKGILSEQALPDLSSLERTAVTVELPSFDTPSPLLKVLEEVVTDLRDDVPIPTAISDLRGGTIIPKEQLKLIDDMMMRMRGQPENPDAIKRMEQAPSFIKKVEVYIESTTGKKPRYKGGLDDLVLIQDLISINDRTSKDIVTALIRSQTRDIGNLEENIDLLLSKSFKGRLPNTNKITNVQLINAEQRLYLVKQRKGESSIITSDLDPTVYSSYVKELQARKEQLSKNLRRAKTPKKQQELQAAISDYQKAIDRLSNLFGNKGRPVSKSEAAKIKAQFSSKLALYDELSKLDLRITTKERVENGIVVAPSREIQVDATKVIGNAGQRARSFISLVKELDKPNPLMQRLKEEYVRFFFRDEQIKGLSLRYRGAIREDLNNFIQRPDLDTSAINTKIEELRYMRTYISSQITDKGNAVLRDYDIFTIGLTNETKIVRKPSVIEQEKKFFTDNVNLYISDIRNDIDKQIKLLEDLL